MTDDELGAHALELLRHELGMDGFIRFLRTYRVHTGNYTRDRHQWLQGVTLEEALRDVSN